MPEKPSDQSPAHKDRFQLPKMGIRKRHPVHRRMALHWLFVCVPDSELAYALHKLMNENRTSIVAPEGKLRHSLFQMVGEVDLECRGRDHASDAIVPTTPTVAAISKMISVNCLKYSPKA